MFSDVVFCKDCEDMGFSRVYHANLVVANNVKDLRKKVNKEFGLVVVLGSHLNRDVVSMKRVDILLSPHSGVVKDHLHSRNSGLNDVFCKLARKNGIGVGFSFADVLNSHGPERALMLGRMIQNVSFCRKFKVPMVLGSFAFEKSDMRPPKDLLSFGVMLGMTADEARKALSFIDEIIGRKHSSASFVAEGVRQL
ncbi:MAG: RNase P subunit p30 family protein [archaeon]